MQIRVSLLAAVLVALLGGCASQSGSAGWTYAPPSITPAPSASASPGASASVSASPASPSPPASASPGGSPAANAIELEETANLQIRQAGQRVTQLQVTRGQTYTFRVTNNGGVIHNFYIGSAADLQANNRANLKGIPDFNSGTQEFQYTFDQSGPLQFACTVAGHYTTMHGDFAIQ